MESPYDGFGLHVYQSDCITNMQARWMKRNENDEAKFESWIAAIILLPKPKHFFAHYKHTFMIRKIDLILRNVYAVLTENVCVCVRCASDIVLTTDDFFVFVGFLSGGWDKILKIHTQQQKNHRHNISKRNRLNWLQLSLPNIV